MPIRMTMTLAIALVMALPALGAAETSAVNSSELDAALADSTLQEDAVREQVRALLAREDVRTLAEGAGLDLRQADAALAALDGEELQRVAEHAAVADGAMAGGQNITISLVAALLIVIIIILLVD
ncbi:MAG: hypothetical protein LJF30_05170 [Acidobacteria bacterium]|nr:hypothetical protein [Acidobacteriota bacterium]